MVFDMGKYEFVSKSLGVLLPPHHVENFINYIKNPYSTWEDEQKIIFVHIPKAAGKAISYSLLDAPNGTGHAKLYVYERNQKKFNSYYKFTFVRNPWDRLVSAFFYMKSFDEDSNDRRFFDKYIGQDVTFKDFVYKLKDKEYRKLCLEWEHFTPQVNFIKNSLGVVELDFIGRVESIAEDFKNLCARLGVERDLSLRNAGKRAEYRDYYDSEMIKIIEEVYKEDITGLQYEF